MSLAGEYLPPLVTKLLGDNSDLLVSTAEGTAAVKAFADSTNKMGDDVAASWRKSGRATDDFTDLIVNRMRKGETAVSTLRREIGQTRETITSLRRDMARGGDVSVFGDLKRAEADLKRMMGLARSIAPELAQAGQKGGKGFVGSFIESLSGLGGMMPILIGAAILASPAIAALIGSAVAVGLGLGFAGIGVVIAAMLLPKIKAQFVNMGHNVKRGLTYAVSGAFDDGLRVALNGFNRMIPLFSQQLRKIFDAVAPALVPLSNALGEGIKGFLAEMMQLIPQIMPALLTFISTIPDVMRAVAEFLVAITEDGPALSRFILDASNAIVVFLHGAGEVIAWLQGAYLWSVKLNESFKFMGTPGETLKGLSIGAQAAGKWFADLWDKIVVGAKAVGGWFADLGKTIWAWLQDAAGAVATWFTDTVDWFKRLPGVVVGFLASMPGRVIAVVKQMAHQAAYWVGWLVGQWLRFMTEAPGKIMNLVGQLWAWVTQKFSEGVHNTIEFARALPGEIAVFFAYLWSAVTGWVSRTWSSVTSWFARTKQSMIEHIAAAITGVIDFFKGLPGRATTETGKFKDRVVKFFSDAKKWLYDAGKDIVRGVIDGITDGWDWAVGKVKSFGRDLVKGFKDAIGSHSPATAFIDPGVDSVRGYVKGLQRSMPLVWSAWRQMVGGMPSPTFAAAGGVTSAMAATIGAGPSAATYGGQSGATGDVYLDGQLVGRALSPTVQRRKGRSGVTGLA